MPKVSAGDPDHFKWRDEWFDRGRVVRGLPLAELHGELFSRSLYRAVATSNANAQVPFPVGSWTPLGPVLLASEASGNGRQDDHRIAGRATGIDPANPSGNTVYIGGAQSGVSAMAQAAMDNLLPRPPSKSP